MHRATVGLVAVLAAWSLPQAVTAAEADGVPVQDTRWLPWIGCWEGAAEVGGDEADSFVVCFRTLTAGDGVEIRTYAEGELVATEQMFADGSSQALEEGGCGGERTAGWSMDGARVFLVSQMDCGGGVTRSTRGVLSMLPDSQGWVEIQSVQAGTEAPLIGIRTFMPAADSTLEQGRILDPMVGRELAVRTARAQAGGPLDPEAVVETVERVGPEVTNALLIERGESFGLDARTARALTQRGVPGEVLDVMVALSYSERFQISGSGPDAEPEVRSVAATTRGSRAGAGTWPRRRSFGGYSPWGMGYDLYWDPFWSSAYRFGYLRYGVGFGYGGYPYGYYGTPIYRSPRLIFIEPPSVQTRSTLSRSRGVASDGGRRARPSGRASPSSSRTSPAPLSRSTGSRAQPRSSSSGGSRAAPSSSSSGSRPSGGARRARPRN